MEEDSNSTELGGQEIPLDHIPPNYRPDGGIDPSPLAPEGTDPSLIGPPEQPLLKKTAEAVEEGEKVAVETKNYVAAYLRESVSVLANMKYRSLSDNIAGVIFHVAPVIMIGLLTFGFIKRKIKKKNLDGIIKKAALITAGLSTLIVWLGSNSE